jgi:hypothetical protein
MSLFKGVTLSVIEEHLAVLYVLTVAPDRKLHKLEVVLGHGRGAAHELMTETRETYGDFNHDGDSYDAFGDTEVTKLEDQIIALANQHREESLQKATFRSRIQYEKYANTPVGIPVPDDGLGEI